MWPHRDCPGMNLGLHSEKLATTYRLRCGTNWLVGYWVLCIYVILLPYLACISSLMHPSHVAVLPQKNVPPCSISVFETPPQLYRVNRKCDWHQGREAWHVWVFVHRPAALACFSMYSSGFPDVANREDSFVVPDILSERLPLNWGF
jgi:hypothetical protein